MPPVIALQTGRFARLEAIEWWDQARLRDSKVLVIGAGALGNEVLKNLALLGVGHVAIADQDTVELSNLSRSVLYRAADEGRYKAECAAASLKSIYPDIHVTSIIGNVLADLGLGWFAWADIVVGALDNREARVFVNSACARTARPWIDGGIEVLQGIVRGFFPPHTACYECTMSAVDWDLLNKRRSCSLLARRALAQHGTPTTPTTASVIGAMQAQEVVKCLHGLDAMLGRGVFFDGAHHDTYAMKYQTLPDCPWHEPQPAIHALPECGSDTPLKVIAHHAATIIGGCSALDFSRELVQSMECTVCGTIDPVWRVAENVAEHQLVCSRCGRETVPRFIHSLRANDEALERTPAQLGLPRWDVIWARYETQTVGLELQHDSAACLRQSPS